MMDYHELINELSYEDNPYVLDYIDAAVEMLEHLYSELKAANARCETLSKIVTQYQDELIPGYRERAEKAERERDDFQALLTAYKNVCGEVLTGRIQELVEADREDAVHIGACGFCEYYQMDKFCCCPDWVEDGYAIIRKPKDYCTKFKKAGWVDEVWGEHGCPSCPGHKPEKAEQEGRT